MFVYVTQCIMPSIWNTIITIIENATTLVIILTVVLMIVMYAICIFVMLKMGRKQEDVQEKLDGNRGLRIII